MSGSTHAEHDQLKSLGKYQIKKKLGAGGMGTVFLAVDQQLNRTVALKVLPKDRAENPILVKRFKSEAKAAAQLEHKNIVRIYETGEIDGYLYIALEYVDGIDVHELVVKRGVIPAKRSLDIIRQVAFALEHASSKQIVHRDIKPANLMIKRDGSVKLADMGLARAVDDSQETGITRAGMTVGTVDYMAPEQARSSKSADVRSDIYSLGCTWYHMLTGAPPFSEGSMTTKLQAHATGKRPDPRSLNPSVPEAYVAVIHRMMARNPDDRYQSIRELLDDLELLTRQSNQINAEIMEALAAESNSESRKGKRQPRHGETPILPPKEKFKPVDLTTGSRLDLNLIRYAIPALLVVAILVILFWAIQQGDDGLTDGPAAMGGRNPYSSRIEEPSAPQPDASESTDQDDTSPDAVDPEPSQLSGLSTQDEPATVVAVPFPGAEDSKTTSDGVRLLPNWVNHFRTPSKAAHQSITVTRTPVGDGQVSSLNAAFSALHNGGGEIQLDGDGPFTLEPASVNVDGEVRLTAAEGHSPVIRLSTETLTQSQKAILSVRASRLVIEDLSFVLANPAQDLTILQVDEGDVSLQNCSFTVSESDEHSTTAISLMSLPRRRKSGPQFREATGRCLLENVVVNGDRLTAVKLFGDSSELVAGNCLMSAGDAPAIVLSDESFHGGQSGEETAQRRVRLLASTLASHQSILEFLHEPGTSSPVPCEVVTKQSLLVSTAPTDAPESASLVTIANWPENTSDLGSGRAEGIKWSSENSLFLGWPMLVTMTSAQSESMVHVVDADEWRRFWNKPLGSGSVFNEPLSLLPMENERHSDLTSLTSTISEALPESHNATAIGYRVGDLTHLPQGLIDHVIAAANVPVEPDWLGAGMRLEGSPVVRELTRKTDISRVLRSSVCQDGTHIIFQGSGLHEISPVVIEDKSIRVEFQASGTSPIILQVEANRSKEESLESAITLKNATLDLVGAQIKVPASTSELQPQWLFSVEDASLSLRGCSIEGPSTASASHAGLLKFGREGTASQSSRSILIENSFLISPGQLLSGMARWETLILRNNVLASQSDLLNLTLDAEGLQLHPSVVLEHCTCFGKSSAIRVQGDVSPNESLPELQMYAIQSLFVGAVDGSDGSSTVISRETEKVTQSHVLWWGNSNAFTTSLSDYVQTAGTSLTGMSLEDQWKSVWGPGHEVNALTNATDVIFETPFPAWTELTPASFTLSKSGRAATWGRDKSGVGAILGLVGSTESVDPQISPDRTPSPSQTPTKPRRRPSGF
ncbi:MAG: serine/threonine-protein kinase [Planctomycetaceae bacterium]